MTFISKDMHVRTKLENKLENKCSNINAYLIPHEHINSPEILKIK